MKCVRCGSEIKETDRACIKCGAINYNNPANESYARKYGDRNEKAMANPELLKSNVSTFSKIVLGLMIIVVIVIILYLAKVI